MKKLIKKGSHFRVINCNSYFRIACFLVSVNFLPTLSNAYTEVQDKIFQTPTSFDYV